MEVARIGRVSESVEATGIYLERTRMLVGGPSRCDSRIRAGLRSWFRPAFLRDRSVCFHYGIVESPTGNRAHAIEAGEDA